MFSKWKKNTIQVLIGSIAAVYTAGCTNITTVQLIYYETPIEWRQTNYKFFFGVINKRIYI